jgi:hypothetical protein
MHALYALASVGNKRQQEKMFELDAMICQTLGFRVPGAGIK